MESWCGEQIDISENPAESPEILALQIRPIRPAVNLYGQEIPPVL